MVSVCISLLSTCFLREDMCSILPKEILNIILWDAIDQYFLSAGMYQEMLLEIAVCIGSVKFSTSLLLKKKN